MSICPSQSRDSDHTRKSSGKQGLDTSGNLYQYDNYDEVAMDTDSETNSPGEQSAHLRMHSQHCWTFLKVLYRTHPTSWKRLYVGTWSSIHAAFVMFDSLISVRIWLAKILFLSLSSVFSSTWSIWGPRMFHSHAHAFPRGPPSIQNCTFHSKL